MLATAGWWTRGTRLARPAFSEHCYCYCGRVGHCRRALVPPNHDGSQWMSVAAFRKAIIVSDGDAEDGVGDAESGNHRERVDRLAVAAVDSSDDWLMLWPPVADDSVRTDEGNRMGQVQDVAGMGAGAYGSSQEVAGRKFAADPVECYQRCYWWYYCCCLFGTHWYWDWLFSVLYKNKDDVSIWR